jgi:hypothetical protein
MGKASKEKGVRREREFCELTGGKRVPLSGSLGGELSNDVILPNGKKVEVKARKDGFKELYKWMLDEREKPDMLALKADRKPWLVVMTLDEYMKTMNVTGGDPAQEQLV